MINPEEVNILVGPLWGPKDIDEEEVDYIKPSHRDNGPSVMKLGLLDRVRTPIWVPIACAFENTELKSDFISPELLKKSLAEALSKVPILSGQLDPSEPFGNHSRVKLPGPGAWFTTSRVHDDASFQKLKATNFSLESLPRSVVFKKANEAILRSTVDPNVSAPLLSVKANYFSCGSVLLFVSVCHLIGDGRSIYEFMKAWSLTYRGKFDEVNLVDSRHMFKAQPELSDRASSMVEKSKSNPSLKFEFSNPIKVVRLGIPLDTFKSLKSQITSNVSGDQWASSDDIMSALAWRAISRSRRLSRTSYTSFQRYVDIRKFNSPPLPETAFGNGIVAYNIGPISVEELLSSPLAIIAQTIRNGLKDIDATYLSDYLTALNSMDRLRMPTPMVNFLFGTDLLTNSYGKFDPKRIIFDNAPAITLTRVGYGDGQFVLHPKTDSEIYGYLGLNAAMVKELLTDVELASLGCIPTILTDTK